MKNQLQPSSQPASAADASSAATPARGRLQGAALYFATLALAIAALPGLTGCADMSGIASHATMRDAASLGLGTATPAAPGTLQVDAAVPADWWRGFGDAQLDALIDRALANNPSLKQAEARVARANAFTESARANDGPRLTGSLDVNRQLYSANGPYPPPLAGNIYNSGTARLTGSWEIDFFGEHRAALQAALGTANAAQAEAQSARLLLAANVARSYIQWARLQAQLAVAERTLAQRSETLKLVQDRFTAGLDTQLERRQAEGGLPEARQQIEALREQMALARNALGALVGDPNAAQALAAPSLDALHSVASPTRLPADLLGRRPDVAAARWRVEAATQDVAVARAQFYPNVNLTAFLGLSTIGLDNFARAGSKEWGVGPAIRLPIFDAGRLRANLRGKSADLDAAVESYNAALLDAVHDAADQIASSGAIDRQIAEQRQAQQAAESAWALARERYQAGLGNYLNVLSAETAVLAQRRQAVDLAARRLDTQVALMRALGGGWQDGAQPAAGAIPATAATATTAAATTAP
ncbi:efflux transporter outer membrane subunit [Paracidovorax wautersii]|uniref:Efflux transporter, outer membrane factor (OMF) lipoprotein, NodT family n=1 Tax=Paracidovorax wautersii TaxID=1177982 RepID=A0A1I2GQR3_9BURK|nr:efflux transporter outer membrane subunit [Paracidovorax wautersii]SFF19167.1 efflux transporter, outer membrane factor (OMF) lipoprotein, NodT family [Paracidovorax wautersii]